VVDVPYRPPIPQAKVAATVDSLSGGRLMIGAGAGYLEEEFRALGLDIRKRGEMTHEYLACMKELWTNRIASFHGKYTDFDEMTISVRPAQEPYPPILYGSHGPRPRERIAESYQGMISSAGGDFDAAESDIRDLHRLWKENGRTGNPYWMAGVNGHLTTDREEAGAQVTKGVVPDGRELPEQRIERMPEGEERVYVSTFRLRHVDDVVEDLRRYEALGLDMAIFWLPSYSFRGMTNLELQLQQMELLAEHVMPKFTRNARPIEMDFDGESVAMLGAE
jgi:alkanesulfonate monooxygenase SsuD/methylene tetrahydromethanopterin reductase-like flavin-dependent oxidoreductase (luciferase family)